MGSSGCSTPPKDGTLTRLVVHGTGWVAAGKILGRGLQFVKLIILARLLLPGDFGLFGVVALTIAIIETFTKTGFDKALIQRKGNTKEYLDTAWTLQLVRGLVLSLLIFFLAPLVGRFFVEPKVVSLLRVMALTVVLNGAVNIGMVYFTKELEFSRLFLYNILSSLVSFTVGVILAYQLRSVWALVWSALADSVAKCLLSYLLHGYRPALRFKAREGRELYRFGRWIFLSGIGSFLLVQGDDLFVSKVLGLTALGLYQLAYRVSNIAATEISHTIGAVIFPAYCKLGDDTERLASAYMRTLKLLLFATIPMSCGIILFIRGFTETILGEKWMGIVVPAQILAIWGFRRSYSITVSNLFVSLGRPRVPAFFLWGKLILLAAIIYPFSSEWGITGTAAALIAASVPVDVVATAKLARTLGISWKEFLRPWITPVLSSILAIAAVLVLQEVGMPVHPIIKLAGLMGVFTVIFLAGMYVLGAGLNYSLKSELNTIMSGIRVDKQEDQ